MYEGVIFFQPEDEWQRHAKCVVDKVNPRVFDGVQVSKYSPIDFSEAKEICARCPVRGFCLDDAIRKDETECVRGGLTPNEYRLRKPDRTKRYVALKHGKTMRVQRSKVLSSA